MWILKLHLPSFLSFLTQSPELAAENNIIRATDLRTPLQVTQE
jgi:hypothetical protein